MTRELDALLEEFHGKFSKLKAELNKVVVGLDEVKHQLFLTVLCGEHALLEGVPGVGKTLLVKALSQLMDLNFRRIQFTPDLMPADILGTMVIVQTDSGDKTFKFEKGPVFSNIVLADEINRATPKTQSAMLECMQERTVTTQNQHFKLDLPFIVIATENPIEMEGTYPLPEAQLDRFSFKIKIRLPDADQLVQIMSKTTGTESNDLKFLLDKGFLLRIQSLIRQVPVADTMLKYIARLVMNTHSANSKSPDLVRKYLRYGSSPRGAQSIVLASKANALVNGRYNVSYEDIQFVLKPALRHRLILNFEAEADGVDPDLIIDEVAKCTPEI